MALFDGAGGRVMDASAKIENAAGVCTPAASGNAPDNGDSTPGSVTGQQGAKSTARYIGTVIRHSRLAQLRNLNRGPSGQVSRELRVAKQALESAIWVCDTCEADK